MISGYRTGKDRQIQTETKIKNLNPGLQSSLYRNCFWALCVEEEGFGQLPDLASKGVSELVICIQQTKTLTRLREVGLFQNQQASWVACQNWEFTVTCLGPDGQISWFIPRIEFKEMENKPPMQTIVEEGGKNKLRKCKLKDGTDTEGVRGTPMV